MTGWIFMQGPLERWIANYKQTFDTREEGGIHGIVFGYLRFKQENGTTIPIFAANPEVYKSFGVDPPPEAPRDPAKEKLLHAMLDDAASPEVGRQPTTKGRPLWSSGICSLGTGHH